MDLNQAGLKKLKARISELAQDDIATKKQTRRELAEEWIKHYAHLAEVHYGLSERNRERATQIAREHGIQVVL